MAAQPLLRRWRSYHGYHVIVRFLPPDIMLAFTDVWIGISLMMQSPQRTSSPIYNVVKEIAPMRSWGALFALIGMALALVVESDHRLGYRSQRGIVNAASNLVRIGGSGIFGAWSMLFFLSAIISSAATFTSFGIFAFLAYRHAIAPILPDHNNVGDRGERWSNSSQR